MADEFVTVGIHIDERPLTAGEGQFVVVILEKIKILSELGANALDEIADVPDDRIVAKDRVLGLAKIIPPYQEQDGGDQRERPQPGPER